MAKARDGLKKSDSIELILQKKKELERKQLIEMQAREEELLRSKIAA